MKEKAIAKMQLDMVDRTLDCIDGKCTPRETLTFGSSHAIDVSKTEARLELLVKPVEIKDIVQDRNIKSKDVKKKKGK